MLIPKVIAVAFGGLFLAWTSRGMTFYWDEWLVIVGRLPTSNLRDAYLTPHFQHFLGVVFALYKAVFAISGLHHYWPYQLVALVGHLLVIILLFEVARRRVGALLGFFVVLPIIVLGTAWETLLLPFNEQWVFSVAAMLAVILLLDRNDRRGDVAIFVVLLVAIATCSFGPVVALAVVVRLLWEPDRWRRIWVAVLPLAIYGLWYLSYEAGAPGPMGYRITASPKYLLDTAAGSVAGLLGVPLNAKPVMHHSWLAAPFEVLAVGLIVALVMQRKRFTRDLAMVLTMLGLYWLSLTLNRGFFGLPYTSRYIYVSAVVLLLVGLELFRGQRVSRRAQRWVIALACVATALNAAVLVHYSNVRRAQSTVEAAELGALQIGRNLLLHSGFLIDDQAIPVTAASYFSAIDKLHSSPAPSLAGLRAEPEFARAAADRELIGAYDLRVIPITPAVQRLLAITDRSPSGVKVERWTAGSVTRVAGCALLQPARGALATIELTLSPPGVQITSSTDNPVTPRLRRFAATFPAVPLGTVVRKGWISTPRDDARQPWHLQLMGRGPIRAC
jgi:hypothetical protein